MSSPRPFPRFASQRGHYRPASSLPFHHLRRGGPVQQIHRRRHQIVSHLGRRAPNRRIMPQGRPTPTRVIHLSDFSFQSLMVHCPNFGRFDSGMFHFGRWGCSRVSRIRIHLWGANVTFVHPVGFRYPPSEPIARDVVHRNLLYSSRASICVYRCYLPNLRRLHVTSDSVSRVLHLIAVPSSADIEIARSFCNVAEPV